MENWGLRNFTAEFESLGTNDFKPGSSWFVDTHCHSFIESKILWADTGVSCWYPLLPILWSTLYPHKLYPLYSPIFPFRMCRFWKREVMNDCSLCHISFIQQNSKPAFQLVSNLNPICLDESNRTRTEKISICISKNSSRNNFLKQYFFFRILKDTERHLNQNSIKHNSLV